MTSVLFSLNSPLTLLKVFPALKFAESALFVGDMNFSPLDEENRFIDPSFLDTWAYLHPDDPGYTENTDINLMRYDFHHQRVDLKRYDRIFLRSAKWNPVSIEVIGNIPIGDNPRLFPSDHFGVCATLKWKSSCK